MKTLLKLGALVLVIAGIGAISETLKSPPVHQRVPAQHRCDDPAACEAANKVAYANVAKYEEERKARERNWAIDVTALRILRSSMHDPGSFQLEQVLRMADKWLCVSFRGRNAFGALRLQHSVFAPTGGAVEGDARFVGLWNRHCGGKTGDDITYIKHAM